MGSLWVASVMHRLGQPAQDGLLIPSQNSQFKHCSFVEDVLLKSVNSSTVPSWKLSFSDQSKTMYHRPGCPMVLHWADSDSYLHRSRPWCTSFVMAPKGLPFYTTMKRGGSGHWNERAVIGHFQQVGPGGEVAPGCLLCCQTLDDLIKDLINQLS